VDFYLLKRGKFKVEELYTMSERGRYWYSNGVNWRAVAALLPAAAIAVACVMLPSLEGAGNFSWFIGAGLGALFYRIIADKNSVANFA
jgi:NCS1 family nucleobase:cation symporter-1